MNTTVKKLLTQAEDGYRNSDTEYALYVHHKGTAAAYNALNRKLAASGLEYKMLDCGAYLYVDLDEVAQYGLTEDDLNEVTEDKREQNRRCEQERLRQQQEREKRELEKAARLLGSYEATLSVYIDDPAKCYQVAKHLVDTAKEVL